VARWPAPAYAAGEGTALSNEAERRCIQIINEVPTREVIAAELPPEVLSEVRARPPLLFIDGAVKQHRDVVVPPKELGTHLLQQLDALAGLMRPEVAIDQIAGIDQPIACRVEASVGERVLDELRMTVRVRDDDDALGLVDAHVPTARGAQASPAAG